jgi:membrane protein EpsK
MPAITTLLPRVALAKSEPEKGRFAVNLGSNVANFGLSILVGLWITPYLIRHLGVAAYGLVPLAVTVTSYLGLFTTALNAAVGRFITLSLDQRDYAEANRIFSTSFWGTVAVLAALLGPVLWLPSQARYFLNVPAGYEQQFAWLLFSTIGMFFLTTLASAFGVATFCRNRFDLSNVVAIVSTVVRVAAILLLFNLCVPKVWHIGVAMLVSTAVGLALSVLVWRHLTPMLTVRLSAFSQPALKRLTGMGGWILINHMGSLLYMSVDLVVINKVLGVEACGRYSAVLLWSLMLRNLAGVVSGVFSPRIISLYGRQDTAGLVAYSRSAVKFVGLMIALPIGLVSGFAHPLLRLWLGPSFEPLAPLLMLMCLPLCVNLAVLPLFNIQMATNHVRLPGIMTCVMGLGSLGLAIFLAGSVGWGMYGVAAAGAIVLSLKNLIFTPIYAAHILNRKFDAFLWEMLPIMMATIAIAGASQLVTAVWDITGYFRLATAALGITAGYLTLAYLLILTHDERTQLVIRAPLGTLLQLSS